MSVVVKKPPAAFAGWAEVLISLLQVEIEVGAHQLTKGGTSEVEAALNPLRTQTLKDELLLNNRS